MSLLPFDDIISSPMFKFFVGKEHKPMYLHNSLVARQSRTLNTMMNGQMSEAHDGCATLEDVDPQIFARFSQWLYTGSYDSMGITTKADRNGSTIFPTENMSSEETVLGDPFGHWHQSNWALLKRSSPPRGQRFYAADASKQQSLWATFSGGSTSEMPHKAPPSDRASHTDYNNYYLLHAQIYCFADKYSILGLQQLAIDKLKQNLIDYVLLSPQRIAALVKLLAFASENTTSPEAGVSDRLRDLLTQYTAITFEILFENDDFQDMLATNGDFFLEVVTRLLRRLD